MAVQSESAEQQQNLQQQPTSSSEALKEEKPFHTVDEYRKALETFTPPKESEEQVSTEEGFTLSDDPLVDEFLKFVAHTGRPHLPWELIRHAFIWKLKTVMDDMHVMEAENQKDDHLKEALVNNEEIKEAKQFMITKANEFDGTPFTIQRLCELITEPTKHYHGTGVFLRALEKNINVVTTITEQGLRITGIDEDNGMNFEDEAPIPVERNFIVSVDEVDEPLPNKIIKHQNGLANQQKKEKMQQQSADQSNVKSEEDDDEEEEMDTSLTDEDDENQKESEE